MKKYLILIYVVPLRGGLDKHMLGADTIEEARATVKEFKEAHPGRVKSYYITEVVEYMC